MHVSKSIVSWLYYTQTALLHVYTSCNKLMYNHMHYNMYIVNRKVKGLHEMMLTYEEYNLMTSFTNRLQVLW